MNTWSLIAGGAAAIAGMCALVAAHEPAPWRPEATAGTLGLHLLAAIGGLVAAAAFVAYLRDLRRTFAEAKKVPPARRASDHAKDPK